MENTNAYIKLLVAILFAIICTGCSRSPSPKLTSVYTVKLKPLSNTATFTGVIQPLHTTVISCPADGTLLSMPIQFGDQIQKGKMLFTLSSSKFIADYKNALLQYLKAKSDFDLSKTQLSEASFLHKNKLISDDDFNMKQSNYYSNRLSFLQSQDILQSFVAQLNLGNIDLKKLTIANITTINEAIHVGAAIDALPILSPVNGVVLSVQKSDDDAKHLQEGDAVKQGDTLALIGDLTGLSITIKVNEMLVSKLKPSQTVQVTGVAFPGISLTGEISRIDRQATTTSNGIPTFTVNIIVPHVSTADQKHIYVGMTADVNIKTNEPDALSVPINAIKEHNGEATVITLDNNNHKISKRITTGTTSLDSVVVLSGLKKGERIVVPYQA